MDVVRVDDQGTGHDAALRGFVVLAMHTLPFLLNRFAKLVHAIKVHQETEKDLIGRRTVFEDAEEVGLDGYGGHVSRVEEER